MVTAVIPSYDPDPATLRTLTTALTSVGIPSVVVANGQGALDVCRAHGIRHVSWGVNLGFGRSINRAVRELHIEDDLLVLNDDVEVDSAGLLRSLDAARGFGDGPWLLSLGREQTRPTPNLWEVFSNVSLLDRITTRFRAPLPTLDGVTGFKAFSSVVISRNAWAAVDGFDERYPFAFEDADFARSVAEQGAAFHSEREVSVVHHHSRTSSAHVERVLPLVVWSARCYLGKWQGRDLSVRGVLAAALLLRLVLMVGARAPVPSHARAVRAAALTLLRTSEPELPPFVRPWR
jgi:GT2 family glycosyltransferase